MGWIVEGACRRLRVEIGHFQWHDWDRAARVLSLTVAIINYGPVPTACILDRTIIVRGGLSPETTALLVWHEIGHHVLHAGDPSQWRRWFGGEHIMAKYERQATEFAETFPSWE